MVTPTQTPTTHSKAELCDVQVELGRVEVDEAEQRSKYPRPPLTASAKHVRFCQGAMETFTQITQAVHRALRAAWHRGKEDIAKNQTTNMSSSGRHVRHSQRSKHPKMKTLTCVCWQVCIHKYRWVMCCVSCGTYVQSSWDSAAWWKLLFAWGTWG